MDNRGLFPSLFPVLTDIHSVLDIAWQHHICLFTDDDCHRIQERGAVGSNSIKSLEFSDEGHFVLFHVWTHNTKLREQPHYNELLLKLLNKETY